MWTVVQQRYQRDEGEAQRFDRHWNELLQELRLAQTGTQILFAFLLAIAFTRPFQEADDFIHIAFSATLVITGLATGLLIAPVALHRMVFQQRLRDRMIAVSAQMAAGGLFLLMLAVCGGVLLALDVVLPRVVAMIISVLTLLWFIVFWYAIPASVRRRGRGR